MKNRREFLTIFGKLTAAGAALVTVGVAAEAAPVEVKPWQSRPLNAAERAHIAKRNLELGKPKCSLAQPKQFVDIDPKWIGGPEDDVHRWRNVWANMAADKDVRSEEARVKTYHWSLSPEAQQEMVDNVFQSSPMLEYLKRKDTTTLDPLKIISNGNIDISTFGPSTADPVVDSIKLETTDNSMVIDNVDWSTMTMTTPINTLTYTYTDMGEWDRNE